ncbi:MAG: D-amino acid dehydrogenase [Pseudomonadota bacterium]
MKKIAIIGAGITGVTTAYALLNRGFEVTVFDRNRYSGMETSFANGGQLSASNAEVWTQWGTIFKGIKWMFTPGAPLLVNPKPSWHKYSWMAEFMANIPNYERNTIATARLAIAAREHLKSYAEKEGFAFDCENEGILHIYKTKKEYDHATRVNEMLAKGGLEREAIAPEDIASIEPALQDDYYGAYFTRSDFTGDIHKYTTNLAKACTNRGATFVYDADVRRLKKDADGVSVRWKRDDKHTVDQFDAVVLCAGVNSRSFAEQLGDRVNIYPVKGYSITVNLNDEESQKAAPTVSILDDESKLVTSRLGKDRFRIAGTAEFNGYNKDIRDDRIAPIVKWCARNFPDVSTEHCVPWAGLRPMMPNMMPKVGPGRAAGVFYNTGHGHLGWTLSAATAEGVADAVLEASKQAGRKPVQASIRPSTA